MNEESYTEISSNKSSHHNFASPKPRRILQDITTNVSNSPRTPEKGIKMPQMTKEENRMISSLLSFPIKLSYTKSSSITTTSEIDELTPNKTNSVLGKAVQSLAINSPSSAPLSPLSSKVFRGKPLEEQNVVVVVQSPITIFGALNSKKRLRPSFSLDDSILCEDEREPGVKKSCLQMPSISISKSDDLNSSTCSNESTSGGKHLKFYRSQSESAVSAMKALDKIHTDTDQMLIGDCSKQHILPLVNVPRNKDLKEISGETLTSLLDGKFDEVKNFTIIDCRYPYEYEGGHIKGAVNLFTETQIYKEYFETKSSKPIGAVSTEREIIIFHCEFSAERGPSMCRKFREWDRSLNSSSFPCLHYPEMYVLHKGYKEFYEGFKDYCTPSTYVPMSGSANIEKLKLYKSKCKEELMKAKSKSAPSLKGVARYTSTNIKKLNL